VFPLGYPKVFRQNLMQCHCSKRSVISSETRMRQTRVTPLRYLVATDASGGVARQQKITHMKVPSTTTLSFPTLSPLLTAGKNIVGYFLDSVVVHQISPSNRKLSIFVDFVWQPCRSIATERNILTKLCIFQSLIRNQNFRTLH
jgi:hypothetical protein